MFHQFADPSLIDVGGFVEGAVEPTEEAALLVVMAGVHLLEQGAAQRWC